MSSSLGGSLAASEGFNEVNNFVMEAVETVRPEQQLISVTSRAARLEK